MRVVLVGAPADRDRLRPAIRTAGLEIIGEADSAAEARDAGLGGEVLVLAPATRFSESPRSSIPRFGSADDVPAEELTPRELEVLRALALGLPNKGIAVRLGISDQTVKFHVAAIIGKLGAANRTDAVRRAARRGLIDL